ncbi:MAG: RHS repeat domain-containing protein [Vulcanimicrobiota bacterium]
MNPNHRNLIAEIHRPTVTVDDPGVAGYQRTYETTYDPTYFEYDSNGNLITITDAKGNDTVFTVGADGQVTSITDRNNNTTTFTYYSSSGASHDGNLKEIITPSGPQQRAVAHLYLPLRLLR